MALVVGLMSGTSMDGIDACLVEIRSEAMDGHTVMKEEDDLELTLIAFLTKPYLAGVRDDLFRLSQGERRGARGGERRGEGGREGGGEGGRGIAADICRYNFLLGQLFADAANEVVAKAGRSMNDVTLIGSHGQTIHHLPQPHNLHGYSVCSTLQIGDPAVIANQCRVTTVGDFRIADMSVGGQGAPLVPYMDRILLCRHYRKTGRVGLLLNIGGISNITALLPESGELIGFDCGPGNVLIDALMRKWYGTDFDRDGHTASLGRVSGPLLESLTANEEEYISRQPPKSLGKEVYDDEYVEALIARSTELGLSTQDTVATITALTAATVDENYKRHIRPRLDQHLSSPTHSPPPVPRDLFVSGGGAHNTTLMWSLQERLPDVCVTTTTALGVDPDTKEAMCFALLAYQTVRGVCTNITSVTGARRQTILGKICPVPHSLTNPFSA